MTKLKSNIKPDMTIHTIRDKTKARKRLDRLSEILSSSSIQTDLEAVAYCKKLSKREVDV